MKSATFLVLGVLLGVVLMLFVPHGAPQFVFADRPCGNGDVNGSGKIDLADPIYLLTYIFAKGPPPEPMACDSCCRPCPPSELGATGQTACYDSVGNVVECSSWDYVGQDGYYQYGYPMEERFVDNGDRTITDNLSGLMWQKETADTNGDGVMDWDLDRLSWQQALQYCENLTFAGQDDWRLPNVRELQSLVDYGRCHPSIDPIFGAQDIFYWSSSTNVDTPFHAWGLHFNVGHVIDADKDDVCYVRAVRG